MRFRFAVVIAFLATNALAVAPQFWRVRSADDFLAGDIDGFAVTSRGELRPAPSVRKVASFTDPFVFAQARGANDDRFFGTGNDGKVYRLRGTETKAIFTAAEAEIYALAFHDGALYAASSPNGKVYRIDPNDGKSTVFYDPRQAYIWALAFAPGGDLLVATGIEGKLFRVTPKGVETLLFTAPETHVRCIAMRPDGTVLAGGSGKGRVYEVTAGGKSRALYDSPQSEISAIFVDPSGVGWASSASSTLPTSVPAPPKSSKPSSTTVGATAEAKKEGETAAASAEVAVSFDDASPASSQPSNGELYRIDSDGFVATARKFERELVYAMAAAPDGSLLLATGPQGRIYGYKAGETSLLATVPEKQVVSVSSENGATWVTTTNSGAAYRLDPSPGAKAEYRSASKDLERFSRFGHYRIEGSGIGDGHLAIAFRSGNTRAPDSTWSAWSAPSTETEGAVEALPGRYLQWKLTLPKPSAATVVDAVTLGFLNRNVAPVIDSLSVADPAVIYISASYPASPQLVEATNPDEYGIFTSLDTPRDRNDPGKKVFRKGFRTISWRAHDDNGDTLRYSVVFRRKGSDRWLRLRDSIEESQVNFDTSQLPDGLYEIRLTASDATDNPAVPLTDAREDVEVRVDNTPPVITFTTSGDAVTVRVRDAMSPVGKVEYSADAEKWVRMTPADGISDSPDETYTLSRPAIAGKFVIVRAVDGFYNVATASVAVQ